MQAGRRTSKPEAGLHRSAAVQTAQACERAQSMNIGGFSDAVFNVIKTFLERFNAEVKAIELKTRVGSGLARLS